MFGKVKQLERGVKQIAFDFSQTCVYTAKQHLSLLYICLKITFTQKNSIFLSKHW